MSQLMSLGPQISVLSHKTYTQKKLYRFYPNPELSLLSFLGGYLLSVWVIVCYPAPGSDITTQCLGSFCVTQIMGQT